jgi:hypothetical protein
MGNINQSVELSAVITGGILTLAYTMTLVHVRLGSKLWLVTWLIALLILSNLGLILGTWVNIWIDKGHSTHFWIWMHGLSFPLWLTTFNVAHMALAWQYRQMSVEIPCAIRNMPVSETYKK